MSIRLNYCIVLLLLSAACTRLDVVQISPSRDSKQVNAVEVLTKKPNRAYEVLAIIRTRPSLQNNSQAHAEAIRKKAAELGGDAVILKFAGDEAMAAGDIATLEAEVIVWKTE